MLLDFGNDGLFWAGGDGRWTRGDWATLDIVRIRILDLRWVGILNRANVVSDHHTACRNVRAKPCHLLQGSMPRLRGVMRWGPCCVS